MLRILTLFVLVLLGVPVAMHVVMHDLSDHHSAVADAAAIGDAGHGDHEHPIVGSPAPAPLRLMRASLPIVLAAGTDIAPATRLRTPRDVLSLGALRIDDDVGLQALLATFLI